MKKCFYLVAIVCCCSCVMRANSPEEIKQQITGDEKISKKIEELKTTQEYTDTVVEAKKITEINKKTKFTDDDITRLNEFRKSFGYTNSLQEKFNEYWNTYDFATGKKLNDALSEIREETVLNNSMAKLSKKASFFAYEYCRPYHSFYKNTPQHEIFDTCVDTLKSSFYTELFADIDYDVESIKQKEQIWEKTTKLFYGNYYEVLSQNKEGTLVAFNSIYGRISGYPKAFFIIKNKTDSGLAVGKNIEDGLFSEAGSYTYKTVTGSTNTIKKYKRLDFMW